MSKLFVAQKQGNCKLRQALVLIFTMVFLFSITMLAQAGPDYSEEPFYGSVELETGFTPDPHTQEITAGGSQSLSDLGFAGFVATAPDYDLYYEAGTTFPLVLEVEPDDDVDPEDIFILVNCPDVEWHYNWNDETGPRIQFDNPASGLYSIWIGTFGDYEDTTLNITEL